MLTALFMEIEAKYKQPINVVYTNADYKPTEDGVSLVEGSKQTFISLNLDAIPANSRIELEANNRVFTRLIFFRKFLRSLLK